MNEEWRREEGHSTAVSLSDSTFNTARHCQLECQCKFCYLFKHFSRSIFYPSHKLFSFCAHFVFRSVCARASYRTTVQPFFLRIVVVIVISLPSSYLHGFCSSTPFNDWLVSRDGVFSFWWHSQRCDLIRRRFFSPLIPIFVMYEDIILCNNCK